MDNKDEWQERIEEVRHYLRVGYCPRCSGYGSICGVDDARGCPACGKRGRIPKHDMTKLED